MDKNIAKIQANALVPEHLPGYVQTVAGLEAHTCGDGILYAGGDVGILALYSLDSEKLDVRINQAVAEAFKKYKIKTITVLSSIQAPCTVKNVISAAGAINDNYWMVELPAGPGPKTFNMLRSAANKLNITPESWQPEHDRLINEFCEKKKAGATPFSEETAFIYKQLKNYVASSENVILFCARSKDDNKLIACAIGDYTSLTTAFYMFAFSGCRIIAGAADLTLDAVLKEAEKRGFTQVNLGLGINPGIEFFKKKWGAKKWFPHVETTWQKKNFLIRLFGN